jgi:hypothetical protein
MARANAAPNSPQTPGAQSDSTAKPEKHACAGKNSCAGKGGCATDGSTSWTVGAVKQKAHRAYIRLRNLLEPAPIVQPTRKRVAQ